MNYFTINSDKNKKLDIFKREYYRKIQKSKL